MLKFSTNKLTSSHLNKSGQVHNCKVFLKAVDSGDDTEHRNGVQYMQQKCKSIISVERNVLWFKQLLCWGPSRVTGSYLCKIISCACSSLVNSEHLVHMSIILYCDVLMSDRMLVCIVMFICHDVLWCKQLLIVFLCRIISCGYWLVANLSNLLVNHSYFRPYFGLVW